ARVHADRGNRADTDGQHDAVARRLHGADLVGDVPLTRSANWPGASSSRRPWGMSVCLRHPLLVSALALWPGALDIGEDSPDLGVAEKIGKPRHVALIAAPDDGGRAFPDDAEQDVIGMVPRVAAGI